MHCYNLFPKYGELFPQLLLAELELELQSVISAPPGTSKGEKIRKL